MKLLKPTTLSTNNEFKSNLRIRKFAIIFVFTFLVILFIKAAYAAPLTYNTDVTVSLTSPAVNFTIKSGSVADSVTVNSTGIVATLSSSTGGSFILTSASRDLSISTSSGGGTVGRTCVSGVASTTISQSTGSSDYTIIPAASQCVITISNATSSVFSNNATITWTTNYPADSVVSYGTTTSYGSTSSTASQVFSHSITISNLDYERTYHFQASSAAGTTSATSSDQSFITQALVIVGVPAGPAPISIPTSTQASSTLTKVATSSIIVATTSAITLPLQNQLEALLAKLQALQAQAGRQSSTLLSAISKEASSQKFSRNLKIGSEGTDVSTLQLFLIGKNSGPSAKKLAGNGATGYFGNLTQKALQEFQKKAGIKPASGYFGPKTRAYINSLKQ